MAGTARCQHGVSGAFSSDMVVTQIPVICGNKEQLADYNDGDQASGETPSDEVQLERPLYFKQPSKQQPSGPGLFDPNMTQVQHLAKCHAAPHHMTVVPAAAASGR